MSALSIQQPYPIFTDIDGQPLEDGYVWIGTANLDPQTNPINVYWDAALTLPAAQPIRTLAGYPANSGTPARLYVNSDYSIRVMNKNGSSVYSASAATERYSDVVLSGVNAEDVIYDPPFLGGVQTNVETKLAQTVSVKDFGAVGDGVTDDTAAIQAAFDLVQTYATRSAANKANARSLAVSIVFPQGRYKITSPLTLGETSKVFWWCSVEMQSASIYSTYSGVEAALTIHGPENSRFVGVNIDAPACSALKVINSLTCSYRETTLASNTGFADLEIYGVHFNNTWSNLRCEAGSSFGVPSWCIYAKFDAPVAPFTVSFAPINKFDGLFTTEAVNSIYWEGGTNNVISEKTKQLSIANWEHEGFNQPGTGTNVCTFKNIEGLTITSVYQESFPVNTNSLFFDSCSKIALTDISTGSYYHYTKFKNCDRVSICNHSGGYIKYEGTNTDFAIENLKVLAASSRPVFSESTIGYFKRINLKNLIVRNQTDTADVAQIAAISTGTLSQSDNWLVNPRCVDALGNVTTTFCDTTSDPLYQSVSPLGFVETLVTITSSANFPIIIPNFTTAKLAGAKTSNAVLVQCWKVTNLPAGISPLTYTSDYFGVRQVDLTAIGGENGTMFFRVGDWIVGYSVMSIDEAATNIQLVWDYNLKPAIGTKYLFGGAIVYGGSEIKFPLV